MALCWDPRVGDCSTVDGPRSKVACPRVAALRAELGTAERREKLEADLAALQSTGAPAATDKRDDPGAHALSIYLGAIGISLPSALLTEWMVLVPVVALELGRRVRNAAGTERFGCPTGPANCVCH
jgi:hypothetical protein